jgi:L-asparagine oxygenase
LPEHARVILSSEERGEIRKWLSRSDEASEQLGLDASNEALASFLANGMSSLLIAGYPVDACILPPTPSLPRDRVGAEEDVLHRMLIDVTSAVGEAFSWAAVQNGRLVQDVHPIRGHEGLQLGSGSSASLDWHTEDAFSDDRADYVALFCLRNPDGTATRLSGLPPVTPSLLDLEALTGNNYILAADNSHNARSVSPATSVVIPTRGRLGLRFDPLFTTATSQRAHAALKGLEDYLNSRSVLVVLAPGDLLVFDNHLVTHGRDRLHAGFDGRDRWLKRLNLRSWPRQPHQRVVT